MERVVLLVRLAGFRLPGPGILTTAMFHRRGGAQADAGPVWCPWCVCVSWGPS